MRWRSQVSRFAPDRVAEFDELIAEALNNPPPVQKAEQVRAGAAGELVAVEQTESARYPGRRRDAMTATDAEKAYVKLPQEQHRRDQPKVQLKRLEENACCLRRGRGGPVPSMAVPRRLGAPRSGRLALPCHQPSPRPRAPLRFSRAPLPWTLPGGRLLFIPESRTAWLLTSAPAH